MRKGFTLIEILVVMSIFSLVSMVALNAFFSTYKVQMKSSTTNALISESRILMDKIVTIIKDNKIDYEEYFYQCNVLKKCPLINYQINLDDNSKFGNSDGLYEWQFFDPGFRDPNGNNIDSFGLVCQNNQGAYIDYPSQECSSGPLRFSEDIKIGRFFINGQNQSAFSIQNYNNNQALGTKSEVAGKQYIDIGEAVIVSELYLKSPDDNKKHILGLELYNDMKMVSQLDLVVAGAENGFNSNEFVCSPEFDCGIAKKGLRNDFYDNENLFKYAKPLSPFRLNIESMWFKIEPLNDREHFFAGNIKTPQTVTVSLVVSASNQNNLSLFNQSPFRYNLSETVVLDY